MAGTSRQKINKKIGDLSNTINQLDVTDIHRTLHLTKTYTLLKYTWNILWDRPHVKYPNNPQ